MSLAWIAEDADAEDLGHVVRRLDALGRGTDRQAMLAVGAFLLDYLYDGHLDAALAGSPGRSLSLRELSRHEDAHMSASYLSRALAIAIQHRQLPAGLRDRLGLTQLRELLAVRDPGEKLAIARQAAAEDWSAVDLRRAIRALHPVKSRRRPGSVARAIAELKDLVGRLPEGEAGLSDVDPLGAEALLADLDDAVASLEELAAQLRYRAEASGRPAPGVIRFG